MDHRAERPVAGYLVVTAPPGVTGVAQVLPTILEALGIALDDNPHVLPLERLLPLTASWLRGHRVDRLVVAHGDWLGRGALSDLGGFAAWAGIDVDVLVRGGSDDPMVGWTGGTEGWISYVERESRDRDRRDSLALDPVRHQRTPIAWPLTGWDDIVTVKETVDPVAVSTYHQLHGLIRRHGRTNPEVARTTAEVLRSMDETDRGRATGGCALALHEAGYDLRIRRHVTYDASSPTWAALRASVYPWIGAAVGMLASGLDVRAVAEIPVASVLGDGGVVVVDGKPWLVPAGARTYLRAQLEMRRFDGAAADDPFLADGGGPPSARAVAMAAAAALAEAGIDASAGEMLARRTAGEQWLVEHGYRVTIRADADVRLRKAPICAHGLPREMTIEGTLVSHSITLCQGKGPDETRPAQVRPARTGFSRSVIRDCELGIVVSVRRFGAPAGELVGVRVPGGITWLQVTAGTAPTIEVLRESLERHYPSALSVLR